MFNAPASLWNHIAQEEPLRTEWCNLMFPLPQDEMDEAILMERTRHLKMNPRPVLIAAYLLVMPLYWEQKAIRQYQERFGPLGSLPMVERLQEAVEIAAADMPLDREERKMLRLMLLPEPSIPPRDAF